MRSSFKSEEIPALVKNTFGLDITVELQLESYDDQNFLVRVTPTSPKPENILSCCQHGYVFKVLNADDSKNSEIISVQTRMILHLAHQGFATPVPVLSINGRYQEQIEANQTTEQGCIRTAHVARLFEFKPGKPLNKVPLTTQLCYEIGFFAGKMDFALKTFVVTDAVSSQMKNKWNLSELSSHRQNTFVIEPPEKRSVIEKIMDEFDECILQKAASFSKGLIHSDLNECNILVKNTCESQEQDTATDLNSDFQNNNELEESTSDGEHHLCSIIDFGDATYSLYIFEVAIAIAYAMLNKHGISPTVAAHSILKGYLKHMKIPDWELKYLRLVICARFAQSLVIGQIAFSKEPENDYILLHTRRIWPVLKNLWEKSNEQVLDDIMKSMQNP